LGRGEGKEKKSRSVALDSMSRGGAWENFTRAEGSIRVERDQEKLKRKGEAI